MSKESTENTRSQRTDPTGTVQRRNETPQKWSFKNTAAKAAITTTKASLAAPTAIAWGITHGAGKLTGGLGRGTKTWGAETFKAGWKTLKEKDGGLSGLTMLAMGTGLYTAGQATRLAGWITKQIARPFGGITKKAWNMNNPKNKGIEKTENGYKVNGKTFTKPAENTKPAAPPKITINTNTGPEKTQTKPAAAMNPHLAEFHKIMAQADRS